MVIGCFAGDTVSDLFRIQGTLKLHGYHSILQRYAIPSGLCYYLFYEFNHEGLIDTVSSEQKMLRCVCYLNSVNRLFELQSEVQLTEFSAAEVTLDLPFLWRS